MRQSSRSAVRALDILLRCRQLGRPARASEIADGLGLARSSADQLLKSLVESGYLSFNRQDKTYTPSPALLGFSSWMQDYYEGGAWITALVEEVHDRTGQIATILCENDLFMEVVESKGNSPTPLPQKLPIIGSVGGGLVLSKMTPARISRMARYASWSGVTLYPDVNVDEIVNFAQGVRRLGLAQSFRPPLTQSAYHALALPLNGWQGHCVMGLGLGCSAELFRQEGAGLLAVLRQAIARHVPVSTGR